MHNIENDILIKYHLGQCGIHESQNVREWLEESEENQKEFDAVKRVWETCLNYKIQYQSVNLEAELQRFTAEMDKRESSQFESYSEPRIKKSTISFLKIAAVVFISLGSGAFFGYKAMSGKYNSPDNQFSHQVTAPKGSKSFAVLPDGTRVWLNAGTTLKYKNDYGFNSRDVELMGEAYFKVATNPKKPFTVITSELKIRAYGTSFNVKAYPDEKLITTTLEEGKVTVSGKGIDIALKPNQYIKYERKEFKQTSTIQSVSPRKNEVQNTKKEDISDIPSISNINTKVFTSWKDGRLIFESEKLEDIAIILERKFNVTVKVESDELLKCKFRGTFTNETLEQILNAFQITAPLNFNIDKGIVTINFDTSRKINYLEAMSQ